MRVTRLKLGVDGEVEGQASEIQHKHLKKCNCVKVECLLGTNNDFLYDLPAYHCHRHQDALRQKNVQSARLTAKPPES